MKMSRVEFFNLTVYINTILKTPWVFSTREDIDIYFDKYNMDYIELIDEYSLQITSYIMWKREQRIIELFN